MNPGIEVQGQTSARDGAFSSHRLSQLGYATASVLFWGGTIAAVGLLLDFAALILRARLQVGEWPHPSSGNPFDGSYIDTSIDPKAFGFHESTVEVAALAVVCLVPAATLLLLVSSFEPRLRQKRWLIATFLCANAVIGVLLLTDPHGFLLWFAD